ncbi:MAG TPA: hypothetical protein VJ400_09380 [Thermoplasmata archaeon]|nr:hypothetical protein [Thermoplasmata archaeon]
MDIDEMFEVLRRTNRQRRNPVDNALLEQVMALVVKNPLDEDRARCQDAIEMILRQQAGGKRLAH